LCQSCQSFYLIILQGTNCFLLRIQERLALFGRVYLPHKKDGNTL